MDITATFLDGKFVPDEPLSLSEGDRCELHIERLSRSNGSPRKGSPEAMLRFSGTLKLTDEEADHLLRASEECRRIDPELWNDAS